VKVLVAYMSRTGNTKKVAEAIYDEIKEEKEIKPIDEVESLEGYDAVFLGFPIHQMGPDKKAGNLMAKHCVNGRKVVLFITHAAPEEAPDLPPMIEKFKEAARGARIIDLFDCQGELDKSIKRIMSIMPNAKLRAWAKEDNSQGQPDRSRLEKARKFTRKVMQDLLEDQAPAEPRREKLEIEYFHASKYGNGARVAEEFKAVMSARGATVNVRHVREVKPEAVPPADLYVFSSPGRFGGPIGDMGHFLKKAILPKGSMYAVLSTELAPGANKKDEHPAANEKEGPCQRVIPVINGILQSKGLVKVAQEKILVTGMKGPLEDGWQKKTADFAAQIPLPAAELAAVGANQ
jgi:menaquinone-dependent protoporphyrinogen IX oxidase